MFMCSLGGGPVPWNAAHQQGPLDNQVRWFTSNLQFLLCSVNLYSCMDGFISLVFISSRKYLLPSINIYPLQMSQLTAPLLLYEDIFIHVFVSMNSFTCLDK